MLTPNDLPLMCLPTGLSDEAAAKLVEFLQQLSEAIERHYADQLHRYHHANDFIHYDAPTDPTRTDPPF